MIDTKTYAAKSFAERRQRVYPKRQIVLHFTAGSSAAGCFSAFEKNKNGTAFILARDGQIFQYFDPRFWNVHLYRHKSAEPKGYYQLEQQSIGIEIVNLGPLKIKKDTRNLITYYNGPYCTLEETERYVNSEPFRGHSYWQSFTHAQYSALNWLLDELTEMFPIPRTFIGSIEKYTLEEMLAFSGITTHTNYRNDKFDVGPALDLKQLHLKD